MLFLRRKLPPETPNNRVLCLYTMQKLQPGNQISSAKHIITSLNQQMQVPPAMHASPGDHPQSHSTLNLLTRITIIRRLKRFQPLLIPLPQHSQGILLLDLCHLIPIRDAAQ